jgi:RNA polymerase sigma-70 factor (ECF subfamily)
VTIEAIEEFNSFASQTGMERCAGAATRTERFEAEALGHLNDLYRAARRLLGSSTEAEDVVQETYLLAWKSFDRFEPGTNCRAWLFTILFNAIRHDRRKWFGRSVPWETDAILEDGTRYTPPVPEELTDEDVLAALDGIPPDFRAVVLLADVQEFSYKEIADILKVPMGTVMSRLSRSRQLLRSALVDLARSYGLKKALPGGIPARLAESSR